VNGKGFEGNGGGNGNGGPGPAVLQVPFYVPFSPDGSTLGTSTITAAGNPDAFNEFVGTGLATILWDIKPSVDFQPPGAGTARLSLMHTTLVRLTYTFTPVCSTPFADTDRDGDVDQTDFGTWQGCFTGSAGPMPDPMACFCLDRNQNEVVDSDDLEPFVGCVSGPAVPADKLCAGQ
jgi:hypothetical protein